jgi:hypothetical protein
MHAWSTANTDEKPTLERTLRLIYTVMIEENLGLKEVSRLLDFGSHEVRALPIKQLTEPIIRFRVNHRLWR